MNIGDRDSNVIDEFVTIDADNQRDLEVSIDYCIALMEYWLTSAEAVTAHMTQTME